MAPIPDKEYDLTIEEIDKYIIEKEKLESLRNYLGMSEVGHPCHRKLFYSFRSACPKKYKINTIRAAQDGFIQEDLAAFRLQSLPFIELYTNIEEVSTTILGQKITGEEQTNQINFELLDGHFKGHCDGMIRGVLEAPKTWHVWENKTVNQTKFNRLKKMRNEHGEKNALFHWDEIYYAQAQIYMHCSKKKRHFMTVQSSGGREEISIRTEYNKSFAETIIAKAKMIIFENFSLPPRVSDKRDYYLCERFDCEYLEICHDGDFPLVHCKTCRYSKVIENGNRLCEFKEEIIDKKCWYMDTCQYHIYNPALISAELIEHQEDGCLYELESGFRFANIYRSGFPNVNSETDVIFTSHDLYNKIRNVNNFNSKAFVVQQEFDGEIKKENEEKQKMYIWDEMDMGV